MAFEDARFLEQAYRPIDGRDRDAGVNRRGAGVQRLDVGVVFGFGEDARDHPALLGDPEALLRAQGFDVDRACHSPPV